MWYKIVEFTNNNINTKYKIIGGFFMGKYNSNRLSTNFVQNYMKNRLWKKTTLSMFHF